MFCVQCGAELPDDARFCAACGKPQLARAKPSAQQEPSLVSGARPDDASVADDDRKASVHDVAPSQTTSWLAAGASLVVVIGSLGPWAEMHGLVGGSINGTDGDGKLTIVGALAALVCLIRASTVARGSRGSARIAALLLAACGVVGMFDWVAIAEGIRSSTLLNISSRIGIESMGVAWGLVAVTVGGFAGALLSQTVMKSQPLKDARDRKP